MQKLALPGAYAWSRWQPDRGLYFNSHLFVVSSGNVAVDPLPLDSGDADAIAALGGVATIVVTNRDHLRDAAAMRERFGAGIATSRLEAPLLDCEIDRTLEDGEEPFEGAVVVALDRQKTPGEFALHLKKNSALLVGDALLGTPAGSLSLLPDEKYDDEQSVLALRRVWALQPEVLLVGDGTSLWSGATQAIGKLLFERGGIAVNRINLDELRRVESDSDPEPYRATLAEIGYYIGAQRLGYWMVTLPPGSRFCPVHAELSEEELFVVFDGEPSIRTPKGTIRCRRGDFIAFPTGPDHAHQVLNESDKDATLLLLGENKRDAMTYYPESDKLLASTPEARWMVRASPQLDYYDGE